MEQLRRSAQLLVSDPIAIQAVPDLTYAFGFIWAGLMFLSAALNIALALNLDPVRWSLVMSIWGIASKATLFLVQFAVMRATGRHRARLATTSL